MLIASASFLLLILLILLIIIMRNGFDSHDKKVSDDIKKIKNQIDPKRKKKRKE